MRRAPLTQNSILNLQTLGTFVWGEENYDGSYEITLNKSCGRVISFTCTPNKATLGSSGLSFSVDCINGQGSDYFSLVCNTLNGVVSANITVANFT